MKLCKEVRELRNEKYQDFLAYIERKILNILTKGRFVNRKEAMKIAKAQNQVIRLSGSPNSDILFSEDLY